MLKAYKYRLYPDKDQKTLIAKTFGCCRFVYNQTLAYRKELYETEKKSMSRIDCNNYVTRVLKKKEEYKWLKEVDKYSLTNSVWNMDAAYKKFFKEGAGYPKFKSKKNRNLSYKTNNDRGNIEVNFETNMIKLPKLKWTKAILHRKFEGKIKSAVISQRPSGKYYVSVLVEKEDEKKFTPMDKKIGIDLGLKEFAVTSEGVEIENPKYLSTYEKKLAVLKRRLSRCEKGSKNWDKARIKVARLYEKVANKRKDFLHKLTISLLRENQTIALETLEVKDMMSNSKLAKSISDVSWCEFVTILKYKAEWYGREIKQIGSLFPSSQLCSNCGFKNIDVKDLSIRKWICPECGAEHDRDLNAAKNILAEALKM